MDYATENQYMRTDDAYNLRMTNRAHCAGPWDFPPIHFDETIEPPPDLIGFNYAKTHRDKNVGIHFFLDDYQFERVWRRPEGSRGCCPNTGLSSPPTSAPTWTCPSPCACGTRIGAEPSATGGKDRESP